MRQKTLVLSLVFLLCLGAMPPQFAARNATVIIDGQIETPRGLMDETGAGVVVGQDDGLEILTAFHVADHAHLRVTTYYGEVLPVLKVVHLAPRDLAIVKTPIPERLFPAITTTLPGAAGSPMFTYGAPNDVVWQFSKGAIRGRAFVPKDGDDGEFGMTCTGCDNGSSGGGIFNARGDLEGILVAGYRAPDGVYTFVAEPVPGISELLAMVRSG
ncbi:MAG TPA: serine protease [Candidatus Baltobacteraceae bacterium]|jgi:S1-C subfamily serine protease|nr:serine protease [Candidatus Baltobacteraceae bacterium]